VAELFNGLDHGVRSPALEKIESVNCSAEGGV